MRIDSAEFMAKSTLFYVCLPFLSVRLSICLMRHMGQWIQGYRTITATG